MNSILNNYMSSAQKRNKFRIIHWGLAIVSRLGVLCRFVHHSIRARSDTDGSCGQVTSLCHCAPNAAPTLPPASPLASRIAPFRSKLDVGKGGHMTQGSSPGTPPQTEPGAAAMCSPLASISSSSIPFWFQSSSWVALSLHQRFHYT